MVIADLQLGGNRIVLRHLRPQFWQKTMERLRHAAAQDHLLRIEERNNIGNSDGQRPDKSIHRLFLIAGQPIVLL